VEPLTLTELAARIARHWRTVVAGVLAGLVVGATVHSVLPIRYEAVSVVRVDAADPDHVDMTAEAAVAESRRVTAEALDALGDPALTITALEHAATASAVAESRLLRIGYVAGRPATAARGADAVAQAYLAVRAVDAAGPAEVDGVVVDPARTPASPVGAGLLAMLLGGGVLGLIVAVPVAARPTRSPAARAS
jgi:uncharacterized protein involved in exopolysaccharide biosynthesis